MYQSAKLASSIFKVRRLCDLLAQFSEALVIYLCYFSEEEKELLLTAPSVHP